MAEHVASIPITQIQRPTKSDVNPIVDNGDSFSSPRRKHDELFVAQSVVALPWQGWLALVALFVIFIAIGASYLWIVAGLDPDNGLRSLLTVLWLIAGIGVMTLFYWIWREFTCFGDELSLWAQRLRRNDLSARMPILRRACPSRVIREQINAITEDYQAVARAQLQRLERQDRYIARKNHHLNVLYDVAAAINRADNLESLLDRFLVTLKGVVQAEAVAIRLLDKDNVLRLVASIGLDDEVMQRETAILATQCTCGKAFDEKEIRIRTDINKCEHLIGRVLFERRNHMEMLAVPLLYRDKTLGIYNIFVSRDRHAYLEDEHELLMSIGRHLGMAIEKASVEEEAHTLSIMKERTRMAHELHDSLAQTIASLRFKVRLFDDSLRNSADSNPRLWTELENLELTIDEAYAEIRSLITHFRAPLDGKGIVRAVELLVEKFRKETNLEVFFYQNWALQSLERDVEIEVIRIIQESLNNIRKHSQATTVRILMHSNEEGRCSVLIEDNGIGLPETLPEPDPITGEHIGLSVMQERAANIKGELHFESDPDEGGTLVQLNFEAPEERKLSQILDRMTPKTPTDKSVDTGTPL
ncbi:MAG: histidine kinase [Thiofilum sp.]|uniref:GAF domain-containing sensor histidine kinase n=1 Tax=Thiofilum sp. TaxID=2212733 RepID=UPI0025DF5936|nr:histidine kinase [Thiofilum sp.]MBK8452423.1 GAF domain-containing protein [Thiofilum sp.]